MTPEGRLLFCLPTIVPTFTTHVGKRTEEHSGGLTTVHITKETKKLSLVWQTSLLAPSRDVQHLTVTEIRETPLARRSAT
jgi:hypothetical protein